VKSRELISKTVDSIVILPASPPSSIVMDPVAAATSNSVKSIAVAAPVIVVREDPVIVVVPVRVRSIEFTSSIEPDAPLLLLLLLIDRFVVLV